MSTDKTFTFEAANSIIFTARRVDKGEKYGLSGTITHDKSDPLIEFFDTRYSHTIYGQFIARYYLSSLLQSYPYETGLCLDGGVPDWRIDAKSINDVIKELRDVTQTNSGQVPYHSAV